MSEVKKPVIKMKRSQLIEVIQKTVSDVIANEKVKWLAEQENKSKTLLESKVAKLEATVAKLIKGQ